MAARIDIVVQPRSSRSEIVGTIGGALKLRVNAPPAEGKANEESVKLLAGFFDVPKSAVRVIAGASSRRKVVEIAGIDAEEVAARLQGLA